MESLDIKEDFSNMTEEPDFSTWELEKIRQFWQYIRENGGYSAVMADLVWGKNRELVGKKYAKIPNLPIERLEYTHEKVYGDSPRGISCETALAKTASTPFFWCHVVNGPFPEEDRNMKIDDDRLVHIHEQEDTLYEGAWQIAEHTWISMPARALLDAAYYNCSSRVPEWIIWAARIATFPSEEIIELAELLGMEDAVRRICSIAYLLNENETSSKIWLTELKEYVAGLDQGSVWLDTGMPRGKIFWEDENFGVLWNVQPGSVRSSCYGK